MLHRSYLCSIARPAIHSHPKNRHAVPSPRISEWTRVDMTRSTLSRTHSVTEAAAPTTVVAAASPCPQKRLHIRETTRHFSMPRVLLPLCARSSVSSSLTRYIAIAPHRICRQRRRRTYGRAIRVSIDGGLGRGGAAMQDHYLGNGIPTGCVVLW